MRVLLFQDRFVASIRSGAKRHTIRKTARCRLGDPLSLRRWTGRPYRSKQELLRAEFCKDVSPIRIGGGPRNDSIYIRGFECSIERGASLAARDGFKSVAEMMAWFEKTHGLPFDGFLIEWE